MKLKDILIEWLQSTNLFEMAYARKDAWRIVSGLAYPLSRHIIEIMIMPHSQYVAHWKKEVYTWLEDLQSIILKPDNRRLNLQEYRNWLIREPEINATDLRYVRKRYPTEKFVISPTLQTDFDHIMEAICRGLAANEPIDLDELLK